MIRTRDEMKQYALDVCIPMLEAAAERRLSGRPSTVVDTIGYVPTLLEELFRPFWGIAPILLEEDVYLSIRGKRILLGNWLREVLVSGIDPKNLLNWDQFRDSVGGHRFDFQNITELCGLLVGMYFARKKTWDFLNAAEQRMVADYIAKASIGLCKQSAENNHIWFPILCLTILERFGYAYPEAEKLIQDGLDKLDAMYIGGGWYSDGPFGRIDYYEAWSMHSYPLLWCLIASPDFPDYAKRKNVFLARTGEFLEDYAKLFDSDGSYPPWGRSLSYRFAAVCIFPLAVLNGVDFDPALAGEITRRNISFFRERMLSPENGILPPGYLYESPALVESYTSSGGSYWAAKSFLCLLIPSEHRFWERASLPSDQADYLFSPSDERLNFIVGHAQDAGVTVYNNHFQYYQFNRYCNPFNDMASMYDKFAYNSLAGFALSTHDCVSCDNMICLSTPDGSMTSHRWGFTDLGRKHGWLVSEHTPFSNDESTVVRSYVRPLSKGWHARVHLVTLSRSYRVCEGGFSIGLWDDFRRFDSGEEGVLLTGSGLKSAMKTVSDVSFDYTEMQPQPGMHLSAPFAAYPAFRTGILSKGTYVFASVFGIHRSQAETVFPQLALDGKRLILDGESLEW